MHDISVFQIYFNDETKKSIELPFKPYYNEKKDNYFENSVIKDIYEKNIDSKYIGTCSWKQLSKTRLTADKIISHIQHDISKGVEKDVYLFPSISNLIINYDASPPPNYDANGIIKQGTIWEQHKKGWKEVHALDIQLNEAGILPFDLFDKKWCFSNCNYWIAKKEVFNEYCSKVLIPAMEWFDKQALNSSYVHSHENKKYTHACFTMEGLFGSFLAHSDYSYSYICLNRRRRNMYRKVNIIGYDSGENYISTKKEELDIKKEVHSSVISNIESKKSELHNIGISQKTDKASHNFLTFYEKHIQKFRNERIRLLEIGIGGKAHATLLKIEGGNSLRTWAEYFPNAEIYGVDIDASCLDYKYDTDRIKTIIGSQTDREFLNSIEGEFDIIIDDGGHTMEQQMITFGCCFEKLKTGGVYILEDLHTSLMLSHGGSPSNKDTALSNLYELRETGRVSSNYILNEEKLYIQANAGKVFIKDHDKNHMTSVILKKELNEKNQEKKINIFQIYYNEETKKLLKSSFFPYFNGRKDNYYENSVIRDIYNLDVQCDFIGVTSPRFSEKTKLSDTDLIKIINNNKDKDVIIYCPNYDYLYQGKRLDIWKANRGDESKANYMPKADVYKGAEILNQQKVLPFDIFEKDWTYCYCNYWIARKEIFDDYCKNILVPAIEAFQLPDVQIKIKELSLHYRGKYNSIETFVLEGLFGTYLSNNNYKIYNHFA